MEETSSSIIQEGASKRCSIKKNRRSGKCCGSCMVALVADCVAICFCPCAVFSFLALIFFKAPWMMGRRCLGCGKKDRKCQKIDGNSISKKIGEEVSETVVAGVEDDQIHKVGTNSEAEVVYQLGYLGFGRSSNMGD